MPSDGGHRHVINVSISCYSAEIRAAPADPEASWDGWWGAPSHANNRNNLVLDLSAYKFIWQVLLKVLNVRKALKASWRAAIGSEPTWTALWAFPGFQQFGNNGWCFFVLCWEPAVLIKRHTCSLNCAFTARMTIYRYSALPRWLLRSLTALWLVATLLLKKIHINCT